MTEGLGQSQVLAYLRGLARRGVEFELLSFEPPSATSAAISELQDSLRGTGIHWTPLRRRLDTRLHVKLAESGKGVALALARALARRPRVVHGRSYLPTAIGDMVASIVPGAKLVFDCRGMLGDEYVDAGHWTTDRLEYRLLKRYEARAFRRADGVVVLTNALRAWLHERRWVGPRTHVEAIPCCVDLEGFRYDDAARRRLRHELGIGDALTLVYSGSLGSWYREADIARFAGLFAKRAGRSVRFLALTRSKPDELVDCLRREGFAREQIVVRSVAPRQVPSYLSAADIALSFIKSCFSKKGSSPTKVAEYLACGLPVVLNGDIGDQAELATEQATCVVVDDFTDAALEVAASRALDLADHPVAARVREGRRVAETRFGVETVGVSRYERLYRAIDSASYD
jgi:glycosyltransferase involved in cell wall biosynthesis